MKFEIVQPTPAQPVKPVEAVVKFDLVLRNDPNGIVLLVNEQRVVDFVEREGKLIARRYCLNPNSIFATEKDPVHNEHVIQVKYW